jgi:hypothetical protein
MKIKIQKIIIQYKIIYPIANQQQVVYLIGYELFIVFNKILINVGEIMLVYDSSFLSHSQNIN